MLRLIVTWIINVCAVLQGVYAVVEFSNRDGVASLLEDAVIPSVTNEALVPFKSRLLSLKNLSSVDSNQQSSLPCQPQTTIPINQLIQRLSREESVSGLIMLRVTFLFKML